MSQKSITVLFILVLLLAACTPLVPEQSVADQAPAADQPVPEENSPTEDTPAPTETLAPTATPTPLGEQIVLLTNEPPNIVLTAVNLQLDQNSVKLTEAANQIATLYADTHQLETQVAVSKTQAADSGDSSPGGSSSSSTEYEIPSNVYTIVTIDNKAYIFIEKSTNKAGAPIMDFYQPRVYLEPGTKAWVYKSAVKADGGELYYESYDPDGQTVKEKLYFRGKHIQIKMPNGSPDPDKYPGNVGKAKVTSKVAVHVISGYDDKGKPIMTTYKPNIHYNVGEYVILYPRYVIATGGSHWYAIYDSDGKPSAYLPATKVTFLATWN